MDYKTEAEPKAYADGVPVFCAHDKIVDVATLVPNPKNPNQHPDARSSYSAALSGKPGGGSRSQSANAPALS